MLKALRIEGIVAICALLISSIAAFASVYQTRVIADQLSATVWPYLSFTSVYAPGAFKLVMENDGLGPAIVRSASLTVDGKVTKSWGPMMLAITKTHPSGIFASIGVGAVVRPSQEATIIDVHHLKVARDAMKTGEKRVALSVCYCSLLDKCWRIEFPANLPPVPATCAAGGAVGV